MNGEIPFGKYTLVRKIATGGMAEIFLAKQPGVGGFERYIVIKRILPHLTENPEFVQMFVDEMRIAAMLSHPNIVQIHDIGAVEGQYFIAMEYLEGRDLRKIMRKAASRGELVPLGFALAALGGVCEGLEYAHRRRSNEGQPLNIVHRDVSPQNVVCTVQGAVKVLDFGIAKAESQFYETRSGVLKGKYSYMSPEQASGRPLDHRSDIFPLGTILYELTTGRRLFKNPNDIVVLKMVADSDVPPPRAVDPGYPADLERIVLRALAKRPTDRYQTCRELQADLEEFAFRHGARLGPAAAGEYVAALFSDEPDLHETPPTTHPSGGFVSFLDVDEADSAVRTPSFPSLLEKGVAASESTGSGTGSLSQLLQGARRRPALTIGIASTLVAVVVAAITVAALGGDRIGEVIATTPALPGDATPAPLPDVDAAPDDVVSFGTIAVETTPPGARVFIDGEEIEGETPLTIPAVVVGEQHFVVVELEEHTTQARRITLEEDGDFETLRFDFAGAARAARIRLDGDLPEGLVVELDGQLRSLDDLSIEPEVPHTLTLRVGGVELLSREVVAGPSEVASVVVPDVPRRAKTPGRPPSPGEEERGSGVLIVSSRPPTTAFLGSRALGQTPVTAEVPAGLHTLRLVNRSLLLSYSERVRVRPGQRIERSIEVGQGRLRISAHPWADVSINGVPQGRTPLLKTLYAGRYTVVLTNSQLDRTERRVIRVPAGGDERVRVDWR